MTESRHRADLDGGGVQGKQFIASSFSVSVHVDQDVDSILVDAVSCLAVAGDLAQEKENEC